MKYKVISNGPKRSFSIVIGLKEGYDQTNANLHTQFEIEQVYLNWVNEKLANKQPYLPGMFHQDVMVYMHNDKQIKEPVVLFNGEVSNIFNAYLTDSAVEEILKELGSLFGSTTNQTRIYISYTGYFGFNFSLVLEKEND